MFFWPRRHLEVLVDATEQEIAQLEAMAGVAATDLISAVAAVGASEQLVRRLRRLPRKDRERFAERAQRAAQTHAYNLVRATTQCRYLDRPLDVIKYGEEAQRRLKKLPGGDDGARARVLADLAYAYVARRNFSYATSTNRAAQKLLRRLVEKEPEFYLGVLADTHYTAAGISGFKGRHREALFHAEHSANLFQEAARLNPDLYGLMYEEARNSLIQNVQSFGSAGDMQRVYHRHYRP